MTSPTLWDDAPLVHFTAFVTTPEFMLTGRRRPQDREPKPLSPESAAIYVFMFKQVAAWLLEIRKPFSALDQVDLHRFINRSVNDKRVLNSKIAYRYLRLLERCYEHLRLPRNPAQLAILGIDRAQMAKDAPRKALTDDQLAMFIAALPAEKERSRRVTAYDGWKRRRDRAMQIVMALAGLRVAEAIGLRLDEVGRQVNTEGGIELAITPEGKHATSYDHTVVLPREGVDEMNAWLRERAAMRFPGELVFPANLEGKPLNKATVYRQARATFERAGLDPTHVGGRTLRNTFALRQLKEGSSAGELKEMLGLALERSATDYLFAQVDPGTSSQ
jgi:integrase/recombinase XerD